MMTVDRIENGIAVVELTDGSTADIPLDELPEGTREGSVIVLTSGGYELDSETEHSKRDRNAALTKKLFR